MPSVCGAEPRLLNKTRIRFDRPPPTSPGKLGDQIPGDERMKVPGNLFYTTEHEWVEERQPGRVRVGITDYAQDALGDIVYVALPQIGRTVSTGESLAEVESTKSVAEVYAPLGGEVVAINPALSASPELVNRDAYGDGWFFELALAQGAVLAGLLDATAYQALIQP